MHIMMGVYTCYFIRVSIVSRTDVDACQVLAACSCIKDTSRRSTLAKFSLSFGYNGHLVFQHTS